MHALHAEHALLADGWEHDVRLDVDDRGFIQRIATGVENAGSARSLPGPVVPGMVNVHSHAFQRLIAGLTDIAERPDDSFWTWREAMYRAVARLDPEQFEAACRYVYVEMLRAGYTCVGEFHYVHHPPDGGTYERRSELGERALAAAAHTGIGIALLPVLYAHSGFGGAEPAASQRRFINDIDGFVQIRNELEQSAHSNPLATVGTAFHSLRAVTRTQMEALLSAVPAHGAIHVHIAEQQREVEDCLAWSGRRPVQWLLENIDIDRRWCLIHATHVTDAELDTIVARDAVIGLCPTTEANLGDGFFPAERLAARGGAFAIGSDSHVSVSAVEELRWLEYGQRLRGQHRNRLWCPERRAVGEYIYPDAAAGGARALGHATGRIAEGCRADLVVLDGDDPLLADCPDAHRLNRWLFATGERAIRDVWVAGQRVITDGRHPRQDEIGQAFRRTCREVVYD